ncbi:MAG: CPBP family intramembrane metalloprotease [Cyanothece sp. SIO1E1]|nr:CPBP family intramembrane metalloprotease [Cyanothece sp. SIO1E1]
MKFEASAIASYPAFARIAVFLLLLVLFWLPFAGPIYWFWFERAPNTVSILTLVILYGEFIFLLRIWGQRVHQQLRPLRSYGLVWNPQNGLDVLRGLTIGTTGVLVLFVLEASLGWVVRQPMPSNLYKIVLEGLLSALAVGFAEELLFRGWLLDELERDYPPQVSLGIDSVLYAIAHFIKPIAEILRTWPQFLGLVLLGLALVWAKRSSRSASALANGRGRLGLPMGLHSGLVWGYYIINVGQLFNSSHQVPEWITGIDRNPLAGVMGVALLSIIALGLRRACRLAASRNDNLIR